MALDKEGRSTREGASSLVNLISVKLISFYSSEMFGIPIPNQSLTCSTDEAKYYTNNLTLPRKANLKPMVVNIFCDYLLVTRSLTPILMHSCVTRAHSPAGRLVLADD